ncbi:hypothetical protein [Bacillus sp. 2205SS5-2]|uniref:hypothetical protein n=1 Tax=Bacillus sp. 2205SS5-2 TaxID=3109031 RepID=UPI003005B66E
MKRILCLLLFCVLVLSIPLSAATASPSTEAATNSWLDDTYPKYKNESVVIADTIHTWADIQVSEDTSERLKLQLLSVHFQEVQDTIFFFDRHTFLYYDESSGTIYDSTLVTRNDDINTFYNKYKDEQKKGLSTTSFLTLLLLIFLFIFVIPITAMIFHPKSPSGSTL